MKKHLSLGGAIDPKTVTSVSRNYETFTIDEKVKSRVLRSRKSVDEAVREGKVFYGITTGFGAFKDKIVNQEQTEELQENLIMSHAVGVGEFFPAEVVRGIMFLMANYLSKGYSGVRWEVIDTLMRMINSRVHPLVPEKGSVGSSGDLAPSAHVVLVMIGRGEAEYQGEIMSGEKAMRKANITPLKLSSKEGLALINNTATMSSVSALLIDDYDWLMKVANITASLSLQALMGTDSAYDQRIHALKPHQGQLKTAKFLNELLKGSRFIDRDRIQESYSFRCVPQIHGAIEEAASYARSVVTTEINSVTDNPLIFDDKDMDVVSGGNFHGEAMAIAMDTLGIAISELGNVSERRTATLMDPSTSNGLPAFLVEKGGLNSGFMIVQYASASLVSENKVLAHPASVDSIPTSANIEDLVSMGTISARKAREIFENTANVLTSELMVSCQAIDMRIRENKELKLSQKTEKVYKKVREIVPYFPKDEVFYPYTRKLRENLEAIANLA